MHRSRFSPVLFGRDDLLALGRQLAESARGGRGHLLFLAGEAGIGKTRLLGSIARDARRHGMRVLQGAASARDVEVAGGLLLDLGHGLSVSSDESERRAGAAILDRLRADDAGEGDVHRRRRLLVLDMADRIGELAAGAAPVLLAFEDLHWADDLTLEVIGQVARRLPDLPALAVATYRSDELYPGRPMRTWRARLVTQRLAEEVHLTRLDLEQTAAMVSLLLGGPLPPPHALVEQLHARTDGIPLHIEEILGAMDFESDPGQSAGATVPDTLTDAILARRTSLSELAAEAADAAAVIDRSFDLDLLAAVLDRDIEAAGEAIDELEARYFLLPDAVGGRFDLRHALVRDALEQAVPIARRRTLHRRVARHAAMRPDLADDAFLSAHFERGGMRAEAYQHARAGAQRAATLSAHREALDLYRRAIRCAPAGLAADDRAALLAATAAEEAATDDNEAAAASYAEARALLLEAGHLGEAADLVPPLVSARHLLGDALAPRVALLASGLDEARSAAGDELVDAGRRARLEAGLSSAYMLDRQLDPAMDHGQRAIELAAMGRDDATAINAMTTLGSVQVFAGRMEDGWGLLDAALDRARSSGKEAEAARAYRMAGSCASVLVEYDRAEKSLREGIAYAERTEQWNHRHYMAAHLGHVLWATGDWNAAVDVTEHAMSDGRGGITTRITALHVLGYVALGRGEWAAAAETLGEARRTGEEMRELQRSSPAVWGMAEAALLRGAFDEAIELTALGHEASAGVRDAAYLCPYLVTGTRARLGAKDPGEARAWVDRVEAALRERSIPGTLPAIAHARGLLHLAGGATGHARAALAEARDGWRGRRRAWEGCQATIDLARVAHRSNRRAEAAALVGEALAEADHMGSSVLRGLAGQIPVGRSGAATGEPWAPLTAREFEVARLIAEGRTNADIARELGIAPKTVAAHVEHILARLGAERRTEIAAWVGRIAADG